MAQAQVANYTMEAFVEDVNEVFRTIEDPHIQAKTVSEHLEVLLAGLRRCWDLLFTLEALVDLEVLIWMISA